MITRCDHCGSTFEVSAELLNSGDPSVRCGECMSLFDARANLYDEADFLRASENLKPVRKNRVGDHQAETVDSEYLETAETLAVEHVYTAAGVVASTSNRTRGSAAAPTTPDFDGQPDIDLARRSDRHREHRVDNIYPQDIEFERTVATESVHVNINPDAGYLDGARPRRDYHDDSRSRDSHNTVTRREAQHRQQATREREQRALQLEPERDYKSQTIVEGQGSRADAARSADQQQLRQVDHSRGVNKSAESKDRNRSRADHKPIDESDLVDDAGIYARGNHAFIPDDVLKKSAVHRDDGRRDDNLQFRSDTPRFATSPRDRRSRGTRSEGNGTRASTADTFANTQANGQKITCTIMLGQKVDEQTVRFANKPDTIMKPGISVMPGALIKQGMTMTHGQVQAVESDLKPETVKPRGHTASQRLVVTRRIGRILIVQTICIAVSFNIYMTATSMSWQCGIVGWKLLVLQLRRCVVISTIVRQLM